MGVSNKKNLLKVFEMKIFFAENYFLDLLKWKKISRILFVNIARFGEVFFFFCYYCEKHFLLVCASHVDG